MYHYNRISKNKYNSLKDLYLKSFNVKSSISNIENKYDTSDFGLSNIGILAETDSGEPAAFYGVFPIFLSYNSKDYLVAQSGDTMTSPDHQKKGLFVYLAERTYILSRNLNIQLVFGFPNENSYPGFIKKLNWSFNGKMQKLTLKNNTIPFCELASKFKFLKSTYKTYCRIKLSKFAIKPTLDSIKCFNNKSSVGYIKKDQVFFNHKLKNKDNYFIKIDGFTLLIKTNDHLYIGAVGFFEKSKTSDFIKTLKRISKKIGAKKTILSISKNHWMYDYIENEYKTEDSFYIGFYSINKDIETTYIEFISGDYDTF